LWCLCFCFLDACPIDSWCFTTPSGPSRYLLVQVYSTRLFAWPNLSASFLSKFMLFKAFHAASLTILTKKILQTNWNSFLSLKTILLIEKSPTTTFSKDASLALGEIKWLQFIFFQILHSLSEFIQIFVQICSFRAEK